MEEVPVNRVMPNSMDAEKAVLIKKLRQPL